MFFICFFILRIELRTLSILDKCSTNWPTSQRPHHYVFFFLFILTQYLTQLTKPPTAGTRPH